MVVAEFTSFSGTKATELTSLLESGQCVTTVSCAPIDGKPSIRWTPNCHSTWAGTAGFDRMLKTHLNTIADLAEQTDSSIVILSDQDSIDVLRYANRAFHDLLVQQGESNDKVGPAQIGRFCFPTGVVGSRRDPAGNDSIGAEAVTVSDPNELLNSLLRGSMNAFAKDKPSAARAGRSMTAS